jgi:transcriptional regulator with XRE-family HTH domain
MSEISLPTLGARVRHYRERLGLSQEELALSVGAAQQTIQSLESGKIRKSTFLPHLAKVLGVDLDYLLSGTDQNLTVQAAKPITIATVRRRAVVYHPGLSGGVELSARSDRRVAERKMGVHGLHLAVCGVRFPPVCLEVESGRRGSFNRNFDRGISW